MGFPGAMGVVDGSYLDLMDKPREGSMSYRSRKKNWAVGGGFSVPYLNWLLKQICFQPNMQAIVDFTAKFICYNIGWAGSTNDTTVWKNLHVWTHPDRYLAPDEWIMADKGKPLLSALQTRINDVLGYSVT